MLEWHTMDRTAAAAVHRCSLCFTGSLEKALITIIKKKRFGILCTFHNLLHLLPPPQLTRYIWQHRLLTTTEQKGCFHLNLQIQTNSPKNIYTGYPVTHGKTVVQWLCNICADIFLWVYLRSTNHCLFKDVCRHMKAINRFLKAKSQKNHTITPHSFKHPLLFVLYM